MKDKRIFHLDRYREQMPGTDDTRIIQSAIDDAGKAGGGKVVIPKGEHRCRGLEIRSGVHLFLEKDARLLGHWDRPHDYPRALIYASGARDIRISGEGVIDAQGAEQTFPKGSKQRPHGFHLRDCRNVVVRDIHFRNSPSWALVFALCHDLLVDNVTVYDHNNYNNDGIDIVDCSKAKITNCDISSDDDGICLKSFTEQGNRDIEITNCRVASHCNAIKTGTESYGAFRNIRIHDCKVVRAEPEKVYYGSIAGQSALCITNVDGADLADVHIRNIEISSGTDIPIFLRLGARLRRYENAIPRPVGTYRNVILENISALNCANSSHACALAGVTEHDQTHYLEDIALRDIKLHFIGTAEASADGRPEEKADSYPHPYILGDLPAYGIYCRHIKGLKLSNIDLSCDGAEHRPAIVCEDVQGLEAPGLGLKDERATH